VSTLTKEADKDTKTDAKPGAHLTVDVKDAEGTKTGTVELPADLFDAQTNVALMHQVVVAQQAAARQGTHATKTRGQVRGGGSKPYRQKGTGRARQGSIRAPQYAGGGIVHGPQVRSYAQRTPKKMKAAALRGALSDRARNSRVHVVTSFIDDDAPSTRTARAALEACVTSKRVLVVLHREDTTGWKSLRNLPNAHLIVPDQLNTYDVLVNDDLVFTTDALGAFCGKDLEVKKTAKTSTTKASTTKASTSKTSTTKKAASTTKASETKASETKASETKASETKASETKASETKASTSKTSTKKAEAGTKKAEAESGEEDSK
jgi:large subunit ribosomal protein L4